MMSLEEYGKSPWNITIDAPEETSLLVEMLKSRNLRL